MRLKSYRYNEPGDSWNFSQIDLKDINLFVGESGSGKTRLLITIFNLGKCVAQGDKNELRYGSWDISLADEDGEYKYTFYVSRENNANFISDEVLTLETGNDHKEILSRHGETILFNGNPSPKLPNDQSLLYLFKEEDSVKKIYNFFCNIKRRQFQGSELDQCAVLQDINRSFIQTFQSENSDESFRKYNLSLNQSLYLLKRFRPDTYNEITEYYKDIFTSIESIEIEEHQLNNGAVLPAPVFKEKDSNISYQLGDLSSGMLKTLLILTDIPTIPYGGVYLIDEYENSLGVNAIDFLPDYLASHGKDKQFIITTHHPYLINNMPITYWYVFSRTGLSVNITPGETLKDRYGKSNQEAFIKLINDPIYSKSL